MKRKRRFCLLAAVMLSCMLTSCSTIDLNIDDLLSPPKEEGNIYPIRQALEAAAGNAITLKYPTAGEYRSAFILQDIDGDGTEEAFALYSATADSTVTMHLNAIVQEDDEWVSKGDLSIVGNGVEKVAFSDLDGDGRKEIIVGWMIYGTVDKQVAVYSFGDGSFKQRALEKYTDFMCADLSGNEREELIVLNLNSMEKAASAKAFSLVEGGVSELGSVGLDGGVSSYSAPVLSTLSDGRPALYIDAVKGSGMLTEILWFDGKQLKSLYDPEAKETALTYRASSVSGRDFNRDGTVDIPLLTLLLSTAEKEEVDRVYVTNWSSFDGSSMHTELSAFMNYSDGYYLSIPDEWQDRIFLARKTDSRQRIFYSYDPETATQGGEIFRIIAVSQQDYTDGKYEDSGYFELQRYDGLVYLAKVGENPLGITESVLKSNFDIIE